MLYGKDIPPCCGYCEHAHEIDEQDVLCSKYGPVSATHKCRRYRYDPLKRIPPPPALPRKTYRKEDFDINV